MQLVLCLKTLLLIIKPLIKAINTATQKTIPEVEMLVIASSLRVIIWQSQVRRSIA